MLAGHRQHFAGLGNTLSLNQGIDIGDPQFASLGFGRKCGLEIGQTQGWYLHLHRNPSHPVTGLAVTGKPPKEPTV